MPRSTWPLPHTEAGTTSGGAPSVPRTFPFLPASPLRTSPTNVRPANQLEKLRDLRQPASAGPTRASAPLRLQPRASGALALPLGARQPPPPDLRAPSPRSGCRRHPAAGELAALRLVRLSPVSTQSRAGGRRGREEPGAEQPLGIYQALRPPLPRGRSAQKPRPRHACAAAVRSAPGLYERPAPAWALRSVFSQLDVRTDVLTSRPAPARWGGRNFPRLAPGIASAGQLRARGSMVTSREDFDLITL